jgi:methionine sulfoxide reductase heme-binding subunit
MTLWYIARASGIVALVAFTMATTLGALTSVRPAERGRAANERRILAQYAHRSAAVTGLTLAAVHVTAIVLDTQAHISAAQVVVPFTAGYRPLAVGLGTIALYLFTITAVVGASRGRLAGSEGASGAWRLVHAAAYVGWALSVGHALLAGTDVNHLWMIALALGSIALVIGALSTRLRSESDHAASYLVTTRRDRTESERRMRSLR